ncbi:RING finger protein Etp1p [Diutina rugosa]
MATGGVYTIVIDTTSADFRRGKLSIESVSMNEPVQASVLGERTVRLFRHHDAATDRWATAAVASTAAIVAVPNYMTPDDLCRFVGTQYLKQVSHLRILRSSKTSRFMALLKFNDEAQCHKFVECFDGKQFNSIEPELCHVVAVAQVEVESALSRHPQIAPIIAADDAADELGELRELPSCPVCLERLDTAISGLVTIPCSHTFHCHCLTKWRDDTCPVCRYSAHPANREVRHTLAGPQEGSSSRATASSVDNSSPEHCDDCDVTSDLWVCLVCGKVGCSRYAPHRHSLEHFVSTGHCFAMELTTSRVWDYASDRYVHRLVTNDADGKLVELPDKDMTGAGATKSAEEKADAVTYEYDQLLISQLQSQREHYERLLSRQQSGAVPSQQLRERLAAKDRRLQELAALNDGLSKKVEFLEQQQQELVRQNQELAHQSQELADQVKDLMFFLDTQAKCKDDPEMQQGTVVMTPAPTPRRSKKKRK